MSVIDSIVNNALAIASTILAGVLTFIIGSLLWATLKKPKFIIECSNAKQGKLGFSVYVRTKEVENASVKCNGIKNEWETEDGTKTESVDLRIGDAPVAFYPFNVSLTFVENPSPFEPIMGMERKTELDTLEYIGGVRLVVTEIATGKIVYSMFYPIPEKSRWLVWFALWETKDFFPVRVRIIAKGKDEESEYILKVGLNNLIIHPIIKGKPLMEYADWGFEVKHTSKFFYRRKRANLFS